MTPAQLEAALQKSAALLSATEKDRDQWKRRAETLTREVKSLGQRMGMLEETIEFQRKRAAEAEGKLTEMGEGLREISEWLLN